MPKVLRIHFLFFQIIVLVASLAEARVFDYKRESFSTYLRASYGMNNLQKYAYQPGFPPSVSFPGSDGVNQAYSGEFGFGLGSDNLAVLLGLELLYPQMTTGLSGVNAGGTSLLSIDSQVYSVIPKVDLEFYFKKSPTYRFYGGFGVGYAITTLKNTVTMTSPGTTALGVSDYIEEGTGWGIMGQAFTGFEFAFFDNVGFSLDVGYRYLRVDNFTSNRNSNTAHGQVYTGNQLKNYDGTNRATDLSGPWASAAFRIYIH